MLIILAMVPVLTYAQSADVQTDSVQADKKVKADKPKKEKKAKVAKADKTVQGPKHENVKVYMYGMSNALGDSIVYMTSIMELDGAPIEKSTGFLAYRNDYSLQMKVYLEGTMGRRNQTCTVFYDVKRKNVAKKLYKTKKRILDRGEQKLRMIDDTAFRFHLPEFLQAESASQQQ